MKKILAISGGIDSVVMLDFCCQIHSREELVVAHFDHGIRDNSHLDADFVKDLAHEYGVEFASASAKLGENASEALSREQRYAFLRELARQHHGEILTAHHLDDLVETVVINLVRGTGWRGLAVLNAPGIRRPLLETEFFYEPLDKAAIYEYAAKRGLRFREDQTNTDATYLRNVVRTKLAEVNLQYADKLRIWQLAQQQKALGQEIDMVVTGLLPDDRVFNRAWFMQLDDVVAVEMLRAATLRAGISATRPQLNDFLTAIRTYGSGKKFNLPNDALVSFTKTDFSL